MLLLKYVGSHIIFTTEIKLDLDGRKLCLID